jgi:hypothetical protein
VIAVLSFGVKLIEKVVEDEASIVAFQTILLSA